MLLSGALLACGSGVGGDSALPPGPLDIDPGPAPTEEPLPTPAATPHAPLSGFLDPTFGVDGTIRTQMPPELRAGGHLVSDRSGRLLVVGTQGRAVDSTPAATDVFTSVLRLRGDGSIDESFGEDGLVSPKIATRFQPCGGPLECSDGPLAAIVREDGRLVMVVSVRSAALGAAWAIVVLREDGTLDDEFGDEGVLLLPDLDDQPVTVRNIVHTLDGGILFLGAAGGTPIVFRLGEDLHLDPTFGGNGALAIDVGDGFTGTLVYGVVLDGRRVLARGFKRDSQGRIGDRFVAVFDYDGRLDDSFGARGIATLLPEDTTAEPAVDDEGQLTFAYPSGDLDVSHLSRFASPFGLEAVADRTFGVEGVAAVEFSVRGTVAMPDGATLVIGYTFDPAEVRLARYDERGRLDPVFGDGGVASADATGGGTNGVTWVFLPDGRLLTQVIAQTINDPRSTAPSELILSRWVVD